LAYKSSLIPYFIILLLRLAKVVNSNRIKNPLEN
jgi:hypothetical protein